MGYKWKPNASQRAAYREKMQEKETLPTIPSNGAIRKGCKIKYYSTNKGEILEGEVIKHSYGVEKGQHTFTIQTMTNDKVLVKGRNLYPNILEHTPGKESLDN